MPERGQADCRMLGRLAAFSVKSRNLLFQLVYCL